MFEFRIHKKAKFDSQTFKLKIYDRKSNAKLNLRAKKGFRCCLKKYSASDKLGAPYWTS